MTARVALPDDVLDDRLGPRLAAFLRDLRELVEDHAVAGLVAILLDRNGQEIRGEIVNTAADAAVAPLARHLASRLEATLGHPDA